MDTTTQHRIAAAGLTLSEPVDVLILTNKRSAPAQVEEMLEERGLTFSQFALKDFANLTSRLELVGTAIIDAAGMALFEQKDIIAVVQTFEANNIAAIVLNCWIDLSDQNFAISTTLSSTTIDELWGRLQANLAHRRFAAGQAAIAESRTMMTQAVFEQLKMAGKVQKDFLPANLPSSPALSWHILFEPAEFVSGDIYDVARLDENHIGFYLADAVGHSLPAALLTMFIKQAAVMRETVGNSYRIFDPVEVVSNLNMRMASQKLSGCQFATCCYCLLNTKTLEMTYARGGHPYPIVIHADGSIEQLQVRGPLLGVFDNAEFLQGRFQLVWGDKLLLYSDGVEPVIGKMDANAGFQFTEEFLSATSQPLGQMLESIKSFIKDHKFKQAEIDDVTIVGLEIK
ncbi:MAG: hypothetical protein A2Y07_04680 [Planctomycetes bacterium GWF2_50_10]|nr:MAG: hypothetical protein A2Y07_04680 [Planctomycetes bacterium GWF2_50_10]